MASRCDRRLAVSRACRHPEQALAYAAFVAGPLIQKSLYMQAGGQPGHRAAWLDPSANAASTNFFASTLPTLDSAWVRPRFPGFIVFQDAASKLVHDYLVSGGTAPDVIHSMNGALAQSRKRKP
jgi:multiple sugar transport system substrate-binding protein